MTLALVAFFAMFQAVQWQDLPRFMDIYYHLSVANGFATAGGYVPHAFWEYAPVGRPQLYPPLIHFIMLGLSKLGLSWISVGRLSECLLVPSFLLALCITIRRLHSPGAAFFSIIVASSIFSLYLDVSILSPFTLAAILGLLALTALHSGKTITGAILLGLAFYAHIYMAIMILLALLAYGLMTPRLRIRTVVACLLALLLAAPLLVQLVSNRDYYTHVNVKESRLLEVHPLIYLFAAAGLFYSVRKKSNWGAPACITVAMLPLFFTHVVRALGGHGLIGIVWLAGIGLYEIWLKLAHHSLRNRIGFVMAASMVFLCLAPVLHFNRVEKTLNVRLLDSTVTHFFLSGNVRTDRAKEAHFYGGDLTAHYTAIAAIVQTNTAKDDIIWADSATQGAIVALLTDRSTSSATLREVRAYMDFDPRAAARILIWFKTPIENILGKAAPARCVN